MLIFIQVYTIFMMIWENVCIIEYSNCSTHESRNRVPKSPSGKKRTDQFQIYSLAALIRNLASAPTRKKPLSPLPSCLLKLRERWFLLPDRDSRYSLPYQIQKTRLLFSTAIFRFILIAKTIVLHIFAREKYTLASRVMANTSVEEISKGRAN